MPVYIAVEVARRELEGRLLLGLVAAERGYDVVLGKIPHHALLSGELNGWRLPPGILHLKSIAFPQRIYDRLDRLRADGMLFTVQDEEHGLAGQKDFADFGRLRFPHEGTRRIDRLMAWGGVDAEWLQSSRPELAPRVVETGSPRMDLWRPDLIGSASSPLSQKGHVLIASSASPFNVNPFWVQIYNRREGLFGASLAENARVDEAAIFDRWVEMFRFAKHLTGAVRRVAEAHPDRTVVLRPHHFEIPEAWEALLGDLPNVVVRADGQARAWVQDAAVLVHSGSTLAIETSVSGRPVVAFAPDGFNAEAPANRLGAYSSDVGELLEHVASALGSGARPAPTPGDAEFLRERLAALEGRLAADRIVDEWERMVPPPQSHRVARIPRRNGIIASLRRILAGTVSNGRGRWIGRKSLGKREVSDKGPYAMEVEHKFPSLDVDALREDARRLSEHLGRFQDVEMIQIGEREVLLRAAGR